MLVKTLPYGNIEEVTRLVETTINGISDELRDISLKIHDNPEISYHEHDAHKLLTKYLEDYGFQVSSIDDMDTAFIATWTVNGKHGNKRTIAFMSEYDALPEIGHGCGHNLIAISGVAAAIGCIRALEKLGISAIVKLYGTPAEEIGSGKIAMIKKKAFEDTDVCMMLHPSNMNMHMPIMYAIASVKIDYHGRSSHASAAPWNGINALDAVVSAYQSIGLLRQQMKRTQQIHGIITDGGAAPNIIPGHTSAHFFMRSDNMEDLDQLQTRVENCFSAAATSTGCTYSLTKDPVVATVHSNSLLASAWADIMKSRHAKLATPEELRANAGGSTDMGNVTWYRPGIHPTFDIGTKASLHTVQFQEAARTPEAHTRCLRAATALGTVGVRVAAESAFYKQIVDEFKHTANTSMQ
ncbi:hypothetical protein BDF22DRAFT_661695 [Syncephalis plumigaleata]|nr:hypothetical protein BDF22DRAFT_661695 [Syncephalis plumigaleata]